MAGRGPSITFSAYLTGGVPEGAPLWHEPRKAPGVRGDPAVERGDSGDDAVTRDTGKADEAP